jgi:hypothetical protein
VGPTPSPASSGSKNKRRRYKRSGTADVLENIIPPAQIIPEVVPSLSMEVSPTEATRTSTAAIVDYYAAFKAVHDSLPGHHGVERTYTKLCKYLVEQKITPWPDMKKDVMTFVRQCPCCQKMSQIKPVIQTKAFTLATTTPWRRINVDSVGPLMPDRYGNRHILVIIDCFTRFVELYPTQSTEMEPTRNIFIQHFGRYGVPEQILSDNGSQFRNGMVPTTIKLTGIQHEFALSYSKEENAMVERANKEVVRHIKNMMYEAKSDDEWSLYVPFVQRIINTTPHSILGVPPAQLMFGNSAQLERSIIYPPTDGVANLTTNMTMRTWVDKMLLNQKRLQEK